MKIVSKLALLPLVVVGLFLLILLVRVLIWSGEMDRSTAAEEAVLESAGRSVLQSMGAEFGAMVTLVDVAGPEAIERLIAVGRYDVVTVVDEFGELVASGGRGDTVIEDYVQGILGDVAELVRMNRLRGEGPFFERIPRTDSGDELPGFLSVVRVRQGSLGEGLHWLGWRRWDREAVASWSERSGGAFVFEMGVVDQFGETGVTIALRGLDGSPRAYLNVQPARDWTGGVIGFVQRQLWVFILLLLFFFLGFVGLILFRVALPLTVLAGSLKSGETKDLGRLAKRSDEFGRLADLIRRFHQQKIELEAEVLERKRVETALQQSEEELKESLNRRKRLARDLHDSLIQSLFSVGLRVRQLKRLLGAAEVDAAIGSISTQINEIIADMRNLIAELEPVRMQGHEVGEAVGKLASSFASDGSCQFKVDLPGELTAEIPRDTQLSLFHIIHEAFSNALRHGRATQVECRLERAGEDGLRLVVVDNGIGFDLEGGVRGGGLGLKNMRARAMDVGADIEIESARGGPTRIILEGL